MAKSIYIGINGVAKKAKKAYIGVNGVAKKIKKAYIGVNGVAKLFYILSGSYDVLTSGLSTGRANAKAVALDNYVLFAGGSSNRSSGASAVVDAYDKSLTRVSINPLSQARTNLASARVGDYALFAGGNNATTTTSYNITDAYSSSLVRSTATPLYRARGNLAAATVGSRALFAGGVYISQQNETTRDNVVDVYTSSLSRSETFMSVGKSHVGGTTLGDRALFAGGIIYTGFTTELLEAFNSSLGRQQVKLGHIISRVAAAATSTYALFAGGIYSGASAFNRVTMCNTSLSITVADPLTNSTTGSAATTLNDNILIAGGGLGTATNTTYYDTIECYDANMTKVSIEDKLSSARQEVEGVTFAGHALFAGGFGYDTATSSSNVGQKTIDIFI